ncbi:unnamed protein product, partial [marine sediment metagenome]
LMNIVGLADAIYFGVKNYNMRAKAKNFKREDIGSVVKFCHKQKPPIKAYLTTNILIYDNELEDLENLIALAKKTNIDAIIAHDLAAIRFAKRKGVKFHISTQANISKVTGTTEGNNTINLDIQAPTWNITNIELNFTDIRLGREIKVIEDEHGDYDLKDVDKKTKAFGVQVNITEPTIVYG